VKRILHLGTLSLAAISAPAALLALAGAMHPPALIAQAPAVQKTVTIHGMVTNVEGGPFKTGEVKFTKDVNAKAEDRKYIYTFPIGPDGKYTATGIAPGDYLVIVWSDNKTIDYQTVTVKPDEARTLDFDMTRAEYMKSLTPEQRAAIEANKKKNAGITAENAKIADINKALIEARADEKGGKPDEAVTLVKGLIDQHPADAYMSVIDSSLGEAQLAAADAAVNAARTAKTATNTPEIQQKYLDAADSYQKSIDYAAKAQKPTPPATLSIISMNEGTALAKGGKTDQAVAAYDAAAKYDPTTAGTVYYNAAATFYNLQLLDQAGAAADKAIAADPKRAMAYYIKGQALIPKATVDPKTNKIVAPPGCVEAYQEYLELEPNGPHAKDVQELLTGIGQPIKNSFKAGKKG
jgi:tetratricopeptide (TPR) repeat protein